MHLLHGAARYARHPAQGSRHEGTSEIDLTVRSRVADGWTVLSVEGEVDLYSAPVLRDAALAATESGVDHVVLSLTGLDHAIPTHATLDQAVAAVP